jgi:hypothetical protein
MLGFDGALCGILRRAQDERCSDGVLSQPHLDSTYFNMANPAQPELVEGHALRV